MIKIIFVIGASRCGTTMMASILGKNDKVFSFKEIHYFDELVGKKKPEEYLSRDDATIILAQLLSSQENEYWSRNHYERYIEQASELINAEKNNVNDIYQIFLNHFLNKNNKSIACKQTPRYIQHLNDLYPFYKKSFFIHMVRDPRDSILSQKKRWKRRYLGGNATYLETFRSWIQYNPIISSRVFKINVNEGLKYESKDRFIIIRYEDFVDNPNKKLQEICEKIGLTFSSEMLNIRHTSSSHVDSRKEKGISNQRKNAWKNGGLNSAEIYLIQKYTHDIIEHFNYEVNTIKPNIFLYLFYYFILPFQAFFIFLVNYRRINVLKYFFKHK